MRLPDFVIIGAAKAGTTSLYALLDRHPEVYLPRIKEPEFFARDDRYANGIEAYAASFADARSDQIVGEASTIYSLSPLFGDTAVRMKKHLPQAKLIYVLREPVSRAYSYYVQILKNYQNITNDPVINRTFEEFILPEARNEAAPRGKVFSHINAHLPDVPELCLAGSEYVQQIEAYLAHYDCEQILFLRFEDFVADRPATLRKITDFLGVDPLDEEVFDDAAVTKNVSKDHFQALEQQVALERLRGRSAGIWHLRKLLPKGLRDMLKTRVAGSASKDTVHAPQPMKPETKALLKTRFAAQKDRLRALTGLTFEDWGW
jgi:hypothetical protein